MKITDEMMDPEIRKTGKAIRTLFNFKTEKGFLRAQKGVSLMRGFMGSKELQLFEHYISTPDNPRLRICVYRSLEPEPNATGLLWMHGGGYAIGAPEQDIGFIMNFVQAANCVVVSPDYRLSTEAPYPAAPSDCYHALLWMKEHAGAFGINPEQLFVGGDSAGGGLAVAVALMARDGGEVGLAYQMPFYPMLDDRMITPSSQDNDAPIWNTAANTIAWKMYLGDFSGAVNVPPYAAPARETNYAGLPPAYTYVGDIEPFCDETKNYIAALRAAGVDADIDVYPGCFHGFDIICEKASIAQKATATYIDHFKHATQTCFAKQPESVMR